MVPASETQADGRETGRSGGRPEPVIELLGLPVMAVSNVEAITFLTGRLRDRGATRVAFFNSNLANSLERCGGLQRHLDGFVILNDGLATDVAALLVRGQRFPANLNGSDLTPALLAALPSGTRVFLYGATERVVTRYADHIHTTYGVEICGMSNGFDADPAHVRQEAVAAEPDVVLVALGNPQQELWIASYPETGRRTLLLGVGALFDYATAEQKRAPRAIRRLRAEWLYRLACDPRRLGRRYTLDMAEFFWRVWRYERRRAADGAL